MECVKLILVTALALASDEALLQEETEQFYEPMRATLTAFCETHRNYDRRLRKNKCAIYSVSVCT
jgi:hypothetical protein